MLQSVTSLREAIDHFICVDWHPTSEFDGVVWSCDVGKICCFDKFHWENVAGLAAPRFQVAAEVRVQ